MFGYRPLCSHSKGCQGPHPLHRSPEQTSASFSTMLLLQCVTTRPAELRNCYKIVLATAGLRERGGGRTGLHRPACVNTHNLCSSLHCCIDSGGRPAAPSPPQQSTLATLTGLPVKRAGRSIYRNCCPHRTVIKWLAPAAVQLCTTMGLV